MASSMCGPSNALSSLHKHTITDRSLQQDRLQLPAPSSQLFRTPITHTSNQQLENEFSQFSAGLPQGTHSHVHPLHHARADGWASDFQRLHIGATGPATSFFQQQQQQKQQQPQGWAASNWHEEFLQTTHVAEPLLRGQNTGMYSGGFGQSLQMGTGGMYMGSGIQAGSTMQQNFRERFDDAAFERAFEDARVQLEGSQSREVVRETVVVAEEKKEVKDKEHDSDELARTAAHLLDSLRGNQSQKFQDSTFLALMRRLRDREVKVEGDKMVEVSSQ